MADVSSSYTATSQPAFEFDEWWLKDLDTPADSIELTVAKMSRTKPEEQARYKLLGRSKVVTVRDVIRGEELSLQLEFLSKTTWQEFEVLRNKQKTLLLQSGWLEEQWYVSIGSQRGLDVMNTDPPAYMVTVDFVESDKP